MTDLRLGWIGAGQMAQALTKGFVASGLVDPGSITAHDPAPAATNALRQIADGATIAADGGEVAARSDVVFLAVKPQHMDAVMSGLRGAVTDEHLVVSIAAGVKLDDLRQGLEVERLIRVMPNTPCLVGEGASAYALGPAATEADAATVEELLAAVGVALRVDESLMDAVTGLSGSGPAFAYLAIEALSDGGVRVGLPRAVATRLAAQTLLGAARMVLETGEHPGVLKDRVASPDGTTIAGIQALEEEGFRAALIRAVEAAAMRSRELGE